MASVKSDLPQLETMFFYGTLINAQILARVLARPISSLIVSPATLPNYCRHHVKGADYPAVITAEESLTIRPFNEDLNVQGTSVQGLTSRDIRFLDAFEGDEYERIAVQVSTSAGDQWAYVYRWIGGLRNLSPDLWKYEDFLRDKAHRWVGTSRDEAEYRDADMLRQAI